MLFNFYTLFKINILDVSATQICSMAQHLDGHDNTVGTFTIEMLFEIAKNSSNTQLAKKRRGNEQIKSTHLLRLTSVNAHPRDARISFDEEKHLYFLDNCWQFPRSVSAVWSSFFERFDAVAVIERYFDTWAENDESKYYALIKDKRAERTTDADIKRHIADAWRHKGDEASNFGSHIHRQIELFLNAQPFDDSSDELQQFFDFLRSFASPRRWIPFRTEWSIYNEDMQVAGQIDCIFVDPKGQFHMVDWKCVARNLEPLSGECFGKYGFGPCEKLLDNKFNHYLAQQNLYAVILEQCYDISLTSMWLVQLHCGLTNFQALEVPFQLDMAINMLQLSCKESEAGELLPPVVRAQ